MSKCEKLHDGLVAAGVLLEIGAYIGLVIWLAVDILK